MEQFFLQNPQFTADFTLKHADGIVMTGSCFSDEIAQKLIQTGHTVLSNPHGTIFHPSAIAYNLMDCLNDDDDTRVFEREGSFYSWNTSTKISGKTSQELQEKLRDIKKTYRESVLKAKVMVVTFGTAWGYELADTNDIVANCHKMPATTFTKFLSSPYELVQDWILALEKIQEINPDLQILFTVSPVRHIKDGMIENNLSKARLIEAAHQLSMEKNCAYFPSYELVIDVLRDYRFYKSDKIHPSDQAIDYVWNYFQDAVFDTKTIEINTAAQKIIQMRNHKSENAQESHAEALEQKIAAFNQTYPTVRLK